MSRRSAPLVLPDELLEQNDNTLSDTQKKKQAKVLLSHLQADIMAFRDTHFPPDLLRQIKDLPIYQGNLEEVQTYHHHWQGLIDRAMCFYPSAYLPPDNLPLPASLEIPQFIYHVQKVHLTKTRAKESKSFGAVGALLDKCGDYTAKEIDQMEQLLSKHPKARLVAHREFIDLRAYVFCRNSKGELLEPERIRFYRTGLILHTLEDFKVVDSRQKPRKRRNDAYQNPIADNDVWKVFVKF